MSFTPFLEGLQLLAECCFRGGTQPTLGDFKVLLLGAGSYNESSSLSTVLSYELTGYSRQTYAPSGSSIDTVNKVVKFPTVQVTFSNAGTTNLEYSSVVIIANASSTPKLIGYKFNLPDGSGSLVRTIAPGKSEKVNIDLNFG